MGLSGQIDLALVMALLEGELESPPWRSFLDLMKVHTGADFITLHFRPPGKPIEETLDLFSGNVPVSAMMEITQQYFYSGDQSVALRLAEGELHTLEELVGLRGDDDGSFRRFFQDHGVEGIRQMRLREASGVDAWMTIIRRNGDFSPQQETVMTVVAPVLRSVLRHYVALERERFVSSLASDATHRLRFGWLTLDAEGRLLDGDEQGLHLMKESGVLGRSASGHLTAKSHHLQREIATALSRIAAKPRSRAYAITLKQDPWLDMLLVPTSRRSISPGRSPAVIAYIHGDSWQAADCHEQLAELFALSPSEARLALAVCRGMSIAEAADELGISVGTARSYSKAIYAKTGARGLPDLVRIVMRSVLTIVQEP